MSAEIYAAAIAVTNLEEQLFQTKESLCDGSMLKGYTSKKEVDLAEVQNHMTMLKARFEMLEEAVRRLA